MTLKVGEKDIEIFRVDLSQQSVCLHSIVKKLTPKRHDMRTMRPTAFMGNVCADTIHERPLS